MLYKIKPFVWEKDNLWDEYRTQTSFATYRVWYTENQFYWSYLIDEYYDEDIFECESFEDGKQKAWKHWVGRLEECLINQDDKLEKIKQIIIDPKNRSSKTLKQQCELLDSIYKIIEEDE